MRHIKQLLCVMCAVICVSMSSGLVSAETGGVLSATEQGSAVAGSYAVSGNPILLPRRSAGPFSPAVRVAACIGLGDPCKRNSQCCSGKCVAGFAEGIPGAWCGD